MICRKAFILAAGAAGGLALCIGILPSAASASMIQATISFQTKPMTAVGTVTVTLSYNAAVLTPIQPPNPGSATEVAVIPLQAGLSAFWIGNVVGTGELRMAGISATGITQAGDLAAVQFSFDEDLGMQPDLMIERFELTDVFGRSLNSPTVSMMVTPEPAPAALVALGFGLLLSSRRLGKRAR